MEDLQISHESDSELALWIASGEFDKAVNVLSNSPESFAKFIDITGKSITQSKKEAEEIRDRNFFVKMFSSNSTDLAKIVLEQNTTMGSFFVMLQLLTLATKGNVQLLSSICQSVEKASRIEGNEQKNLFNLAVNFLEKNISSIKEAEIRDNALKKLLKANEVINTFDYHIANQVDANKTEFNNKIKEEHDKMICQTKDVASKAEAQLKETVSILKEEYDKKLEEYDRKLHEYDERSEEIKKRLSKQIKVLTIALTVVSFVLIAGMLFITI